MKLITFFLVSINALCGAATLGGKCDELESYKGIITVEIIMTAQACHDLIDKCYKKKHEYCNKPEHVAKVTSTLWDSPLTTVGSSKTQQYAKQLQQQWYGDNESGIVITSELLRAIQTGAYLYSKKNIYVAPFLIKKADPNQLSSVPRSQKKQIEFIKESNENNYYSIDIEISKLNYYLVDKAKEKDYTPNSEIKNFPNYLAQQFIKCPNAFPEIEKKLRKDENIKIVVVTHCDTVNVPFIQNKVIGGGGIDCDYAYNSEWAINVPSKEDMEKVEMVQTTKWKKSMEGYKQYKSFWRSNNDCGYIKKEKVCESVFGYIFESWFGDCYGRQN